MNITRYTSRITHRMYVVVYLVLGLFAERAVAVAGDVAVRLRR
jgi:hypothetical protein